MQKEGECNHFRNDPSLLISTAIARYKNLA